MNLYEINSNYSNWLAKAQEADGELTPEMLAELDQINIDADTKHEAYAVIIKQFKGEADLLKAEEDRLIERRRQKERDIERLTERLTSSMQFFGKEKFETPKCKISFRTSKCIEITDESLIPDIYFKIEKKPLKSEIKAAIGEGKEVAGAVLVEKKNIQIK